MTVRKTSHARYELGYHFAWGTKYRKKIFSNDSLKDEVKRLFREIAGHYDIEVGAIEVLSDHIHFLASAPPRIAPATIAQILKSTSTKMLFERHKWLEGYYWGGEIWAGGYFVRSAGSGLTKEAIVRYIREQSEEIA